LSTLGWVVTVVVLVGVGYLTQDIWAPRVNGLIGKVPYATTARSKVASFGGSSTGY